MAKVREMSCMLCGMAPCECTKRTIKKAVRTLVATEPVPAAITPVVPQRRVSAVERMRAASERADEATDGPVSARTAPDTPAPADHPRPAGTDVRNDSTASDTVADTGVMDAAMAALMPLLHPDDQPPGSGYLTARATRLRERMHLE